MLKVWGGWGVMAELHAELGLGLHIRTRGGVLAGGAFCLYIALQLISF